MSNRLILYPYKMASASVNALANALTERKAKVLKVFPDRNFKPKDSDVVINWGNSTEPSWDMGTPQMFLNLPNRVDRASNKLTALVKMNREGIPAPWSTEQRVQAQERVNNAGVIVVRHILRGHSGNGIELVGLAIDAGDRTGIVPEAPLYTEYVKKAREYRVHVLLGEVILWQQKMARKDYDGEINYQIRSHETGWVYCTEAATPPDNVVLHYAVEAVRALGLQIGAVDIIWNDKAQQAYVLEVNTAPGLAGATINTYADAILKRVPWK